MFISIDIFREKLHNKGVDTENKLEAWLTFLGEDDPEWILKLIEVYPEFEVLYREVYEMCRNTERIMGIFSKELAELDKNTVQYMIDEMQDTIDAQSEQLSQKDEQLSQKDEQLSQKDEQLSQMSEQLSAMGEMIEEMKRQMEALQKQVQAQI